MGVLKRSLSKLGMSLKRSVSSRRNSLGSNREFRVIIEGLSGAGKTSILYKLKLGESINPVPTVGFNVEMLKDGAESYSLWDVGSQRVDESFDDCMYHYADYLIYVIDSTDTQRISAAKEKLQSLLSRPELKDTAFIILCNKQDNRDALSVDVLIHELSVSSLKCRKVIVKGCSAKSGQGFSHGFSALLKEPSTQ